MDRLIPWKGVGEKSSPLLLSQGREQPPTLSATGDAAHPLYNFGMKIHTGIDDGFGMIHSLEVPAANEHDLNAVEAFLHGDDTRVFDRSSYRDLEKRKEHLHRNVNWFIVRAAILPGQKKSKPVFERRSKIRFSPSNSSSATPKSVTAARGQERQPALPVAVFSNVLTGERSPRRGSVSGFRQNGGNQTKDKQIDWGFIAVIGSSPDRNPRSVSRPGYSEVP